MNRHVIIIACLYVAYALPVAENESETLELVQIPLKDGKELDILSLADNNGKLSERNKRTIGILRDLFPELTKVNGDNSIDMAALNEQLQETIRVARQSGGTEEADSQNESNSGQHVSELKAPGIDELALDSEDIEGDDRSKRFLFNFGAQAGTNSGGSGKFFFDVLRLFSGSSPTQQTDERANAVITTDVATEIGAVNNGAAGGDGYTEGIPGPVTRLFVLANRGISNLIQDLILRIAQTSERVVNFKARLITSLI